MAAEITYPLPEGISASMIVLIYNIATLIMLFVAPLIDISWINTIQTAGIAGCGFLVLFVKMKYSRSDDEKSKLQQAKA